MSSKIKGGPFGESDVPVNIQHALNDIPGVLPIVRAMGYSGEHALERMGPAALGAAVDKERHVGWAEVGVAAFTSHTASVVFKHIVRHPRPHDHRIAIGVGTPSKLSFLSSHAASTTAALVGITELGHPAAPAMGVPAIMLSHLVLGVCYPIDVTLGAALGTATALVVDRIGDKIIGPKKAQRNQDGQPSITERNTL